jgi:hypothetical protein
MDTYGNAQALADTVWLESAEGPSVTLPDPAALVGGVQQFTVTYTGYGTSRLRAIGRRRGVRSIPVTGVTRTWTGNVSPDWETGGNWMELAAPGSLDSVAIPASRPFYPVLTSNISIGGVNVDDGATLDLDAFDLTSTSSVSTGAMSGSITSTTGRLILAGTGTGNTLQGRLPRMQVTGSYSLAGPVVSRARLQVAGGRVRTLGHRLQTASF